MAGNLNDYYFVVGDTNPTTQVWSTAATAYVANTSLAYANWLANDNPVTGNFGFITTVFAVSNNGSGACRLFVNNASQLQTGQVWRVQGVNSDANGTWTITKIDANHVDLQGSTFTGLSAGLNGALQGAAIIDTNVDLLAAINLNNAARSLPFSVTVTFNGGGVLLTPQQFQQGIININNTGSIAAVSLPDMRSFGLLPIGATVRIANVGPGVFEIVYNDNRTLIDVVQVGDAIDLTLTDNTTQEGTFQIRYVRGDPGSVMSIRGSAFARRLANTAQMNVVANGIATGPFIAKCDLSSTLDCTVRGPNGVDQQTTMPLSGEQHVFGITQGSFGQSIQSPSPTSASLISFFFSAPFLPFGFTYYTYLFPLVMAGNNVFPDIWVEGDTVFFRNGPIVLNQGHALTSSTVNVGNFVPSKCSTMIFNIESAGLVADTSGIATLAVNFEADQGTLFDQRVFSMQGLAPSTMTFMPMGRFEMPNNPAAHTRFFYYLQAINGSAPFLTIRLIGYRFGHGRPVT